MRHRILLADDESTFRKTVAIELREQGFEVTAVADGIAAIEALQERYDVAILDIQMPGADGVRVLRHIRETDPDMRVLMITAYGSVEMAVEAIKLGAADYVLKPVMFEDLLTRIRQQVQYRLLESENRALRDDLESKYGLGNIIGAAPAMQKVFETIGKLGRISSNVLVVGESGTGKELVARAIHAQGQDRPGKFVGLNCSAIPESLLESELFGHRKGSFTSAVEDRKGLFEAADRGTLFLDEIGYMPLAQQVKLLRAIEERRIIPVGGTEPISLDLRIVSATNRDLPEEIQAGRFREDLYYRLNVVSIHLPPLRERREDIPLLAEHFVRMYNAQMGKHCRGVSDEAMLMLLEHEWRGNIRELQNHIERAIIFAEGDEITPADLGATGAGAGSASENLQDYLKRSERAHLCRVLRKYNADKPAAARALGVGLSSLYRKLAELDIRNDHLN